MNHLSDHAIHALARMRTRRPPAAEDERRINDWAARGIVFASDRGTRSGMALPWPPAAEKGGAA